MSTRRVRFSMPLTSEQPDPISAGESFVSALQQKALAKWWGNFVPIDQWTPPNIRHKFKDLPFRKNDMTAEIRIDTPESHLGDSTPDVYNCNFARVEEAIQELSDKVEEPMDCDGSLYDLGWDGISAVSQDVGPPSEQDMAAEVAKAADDNDDPVYDLSWVATTVELTVMDNSVIDLTIDETPEPSAPLPMEEEVIDLTKEDSPVYDLGWGSSADDKETAKSGHSSPIRMEMDVRSTSLSNHVREAEDNILWRNRFMKAIGNDMTDEHVHAIVENAVYGLNGSCVPSQILMDNRQTFGMFAESQNRVTDVSLDICMLHGMIQLQCQLLRTVDSIIVSLEDNNN
ncbi:uncharacterized protein F5147DRAFT_652730 [Suillus discolor]|uniref:Uncharacterized protein n=1 Tax=Suillus discolor TaxID=1912936 RepID=A0A9P7JUN8_9AGAM|nr:uncharacterized protein F5147DRAFT_652730 [Suillus discolor]KAG2108743.1 hypothetical protein F5147DRAFT_652730 [Suillus discolor]